MARTTGRVSLADMVEQGILRDGEVIVIRRRSASEIEAKVQADGGIALSRQVFRTPTAAAKQALGVDSIDGWIRWRVPRLGGRTLADLRGTT